MRYITGLCILKWGVYIPWLSDHCAIRYIFNFTKCSQSDNHLSGCVDNMYQSFYWGKDSEDKFKKGLQLMARNEDLQRGTKGKMDNRSNEDDI